MKALSHSQASSLDVTQTSYTNFNSGGSEGGCRCTYCTFNFLFFFIFVVSSPTAVQYHATPFSCLPPPQPCSLRRSSSVVISSVSVRLLYRELFGFFLFVWFFFQGTAQGVVTLHWESGGDWALDWRWFSILPIRQVLTQIPNTSTLSWVFVLLNIRIF